MRRISLRWFLLSCLVIGVVAGMVVPNFLQRESATIPSDILQRINQEFGYFDAGDQAQEMIEAMYGRALNVDKTQFARAVLVLAEGNLTELQELVDIKEDPRDTLIRALRDPGKDDIPLGSR